MCLNPGDILQGKYEIISPLGQGGFARTYTAKQIDKPNHPLCVVKEIPFPRSNDPRVLAKARKRFDKEASALRRLGKNSHIPALFDRFEANNCFYLVQEYIQGTPLNQELVAGKPRTEEEAVAFLREVLEILKLVHHENIVHRDITPANLIRRISDKKLVLIDFGAVKEIGTFTADSTGEILSSQAIGTSGYMPAEQYNPQSKPEPYNDIYAIGIIAIQILTGQRPNAFPPDPQFGDPIWHYSTPDRPAVRVSKGLKNILDRMVRFHFEKRYQSVSDILQDLDLSAARPRLSQPLHRGKSRFYWLFLGTLGIAAAVAIALIIPRIISLISPIISPQPTLSETSEDGVSSGEKLLVQTAALWSKQRGIIEFAGKNYPEALKMFKQSWRDDRRDPETLIYMNNALLKAIGAEYYTIAIVVPIRRDLEGKIVSATLAEELLRGIAQAQTEVNLSLVKANDSSDRDFPGRDFMPAQSLKNKGLKVIIADDSNIKTEAVKRANSLVKKPEVLAVIGHYTSDMTVETVDIYNNNKLATISPGSTTEELTRRPRKFFFRTAPTTSIEAKSLVDRLWSLGQKKVAVFYNPNSPFSASLWEEFKQQLAVKGGTSLRINKYYDLSQNNFNAKAAIAEVEKTGTTAIVVIPDGQVTNALENALQMIKANGDRNWIVGSWTLYEPRTLEIAQQLKSFEKLEISVFWHPLDSFDQEFPQNAEKLWGGPVNTRSALTYDAAKTLIKVLEMQGQPSREGMQQTLANPNFKAAGATGIIEFDSKTGNRKNPPEQMGHIVSCSTAIYGVTFVPIEFPNAKAAGLKCE